MYTDLLIRIKNAQAVKKESIKVPYFKTDSFIVNVLVKEGFLVSGEAKGRGNKKVLILKFNKEKPILKVKFLSKPSLRKYIGYREIKGEERGGGILVISTSKGIKTGEEAKKEKLGGQTLFKIW